MNDDYEESVGVWGVGEGEDKLKYLFDCLNYCCCSGCCRSLGSRRVKIENTSSRQWIFTGTASSSLYRHLLLLIQQLIWSTKESYISSYVNLTSGLRRIGCCCFASAVCLHPRLRWAITHTNINKLIMSIIKRNKLKQTKWETLTSADTVSLGAAWGNCCCCCCWSFVKLCRSFIWSEKSKLSSSSSSSEDDEDDEEEELLSPCWWWSL